MRMGISGLASGLSPDDTIRPRVATSFRSFPGLFTADVAAVSIAAYARHVKARAVHDCDPKERIDSI